jgi:WD40 repeat protein
MEPNADLISLVDDINASAEDTAVNAPQIVGLPLNPFVGLRPFESEEDMLFFGRREQTIELLQQLSVSRFLAVVGSSGSGKSSLIRAGLIPKLKAGFLVDHRRSHLLGKTIRSTPETEDQRDQWRIVTLRPGESPLHNLALAVQTARDPEASDDDVTRLVSAIRAEGAPAIIQRISPLILRRDVNLLILVDQFEEVFRFGGNAPTDEPESTAEVLKKRDDASEFVAIMLELAQHPHLPVYIVITMRSDFLGDCDAFYGLPEAMNRSQYLVPRLTRQQRQEAIENPILLFNKTIAPRLLDRVLNDMGEGPDQLPIMQHALMRTWYKWKKKSQGDVDLQHYEAAGTITDALWRDADTALAETGEPKLAKRVFQLLTDKDQHGRLVRRPAYVSEIEQVTGADRAKIMFIIDCFRRNDRSFLTLSAGANSTNVLIDITHESLMRNWRTLKEWVDEETAAAAAYLRLAGTAELHNKKEFKWLVDPQLQLTLDWRRKALPNESWARRYHPGFVEAMKFLDDSEAARRLNAELEERKRRQTLRRARFTNLILAVLCLVAIGASIFAAINWRHARAERDVSSRLFYDANVSSAYRAATDGQLWRAKGFLNDVTDRGLGNLRGFEWFHLWRVSEALAGTLEGHQGAITAAAFSPDGRVLATASDDRNVFLWDVATHKKLATLSGHQDKVLAVAFSPDGKTLASAGDDYKVKIWNAVSHSEVATLSGHKNHVLSIAFSRDGRILASASDDNTVKLWDTVSQKEVATLSGHQNSVLAVAFSPDGHTLASSSADETIKLWEVASHKQLHTIAVNNGSIDAVTFSPNGKTLAFAVNKEKDAETEDLHIIEIWDLALDKELLHMEGHSDSVFQLSFSPDGRTLASASGDKTIKLWDPSAGRELVTLSDHTNTVSTVAFSPDGETLATGSADMTAKLWSITNALRETAALIAKSKAVVSLAFSPDGKILAGGYEDSSIALWDAASHEKVATLMGHFKRVSRVAFSPDGKMLASSSEDRTVRLWDVATRQTLATLVASEGPVFSVIFSPDGKTLATGDSKRVTLWDARTFKQLSTLTGHTAGIGGLAFSPDGKMLATASDDWTVRLWALASGRELARLSGHKGVVYSVVFSSDGKTLASGSDDSTAKLWDVASHLELATLNSHAGYVFDVAFSPDNRTLATASQDLTVKLWDTSSFKELVTLTEHLASVESVAFSPDGKILAAGDEDSTIRLWFAATNDEVIDRRKRGY